MKIKFRRKTQKHQVGEGSVNLRVGGAVTEPRWRLQEVGQVLKGLQCRRFTICQVNVLHWMKRFVCFAVAVQLRQLIPQNVYRNGFVVIFS